MNKCSPFRFAIVVFGAAFVALQGAVDVADADPLSTPLEQKLDEYLISGRLAEGEEAFRDIANQSPDDANAQFALGLIKSLRAVETLGQTMHQYGAKQPTWFLGGLLGQNGLSGIPILRMPVPVNKQPALMTHDDFRGMMLRFQRDLTAARQQLSRVPASRVKLAVRFGMIRLDLNRNGKTESGEELWRIYGQVNRAAPRVRPVQASQFSIAIDEGDVHWLHGYCHLLGAITEIILAHDTSEIFYRSGFMVFPHIDSPYKDFAKNGGPIQGIINEVTLIHLINLPVREPQRMERARRHLLEVIRTGRLSWQAIRAETDNDREWIPNSEQTALSPAMRVTEPMIKGWLEFQDEAELLLEGKLLAPFWRGDNKKLGVNVKRVFQEPRRLDLILWAQGTAAAPYLEEGELTKPETWERFQTLFGGQFLRFAVWFN